MKFLKFTFLITLLFFPLFGKPPLPFIHFDHPDYDAGFFSVLNSVVGCLDAYEKEECRGFKVDFGTKGHYYDAAHGSNWWTYYLEPLKVGSDGFYTIRYHGQELERLGYRAESLTKERVHALIKRYFRFKPFIINKINTFVSRNFQNHRVIGVHYRGTDKFKESNPISYETVFDEIAKIIQPDDLIFVATDEIAFLEELQEKFSAKVLFIKATRSKNGLPVHSHHAGISGYRLGVEALMDAFILSKCNYLIRTSSNLSLFSTYLNPTLPTLVLNQEKATRNRYQDLPGTHKSASLLLERLSEHVDEEEL